MVRRPSSTGATTADAAAAAALAQGIVHLRRRGQLARASADAAAAAADELCACGLGSFDALRRLADDEWPEVLCNEDSERGLSKIKSKLATGAPEKLMVSRSERNIRLLQDGRLRRELRKEQRTPWPTRPLEPGAKREILASSRRSVQEAKGTSNRPSLPPDLLGCLVESQLVQ